MKVCKKVLLINPEDSRSKLNFDGIIVNEPLDLEIIYTALIKNDIKAKFYDFLTNEKEDLKSVIEEYKPDFICTTAVINQIPFVLEYFNIAKHVNKNIKTIITGSYAEHNYRQLFLNCIDYISRSYDPNCIVDIISDVDNKNINGLCYKVNNVWKNNKLSYFDINSITTIDRKHFYKNKKIYRYLEMVGACQVRTSYSCPYKCKFCYRTILNNNKYVTKDIIKVVDEIESIKSDNIYIVDDDFLFNRNRLIEFITEVKKRKIHKKYICYGRVDFILKNKDIIKELKEIGFYYILVGLEAINDNNLNNYNKLIKKDDNVNCVQFLNDIGINCMGMFIIDLNFKRKDFKNLYNWIKTNNLKHVALSIFTPLPGTKLYNEYKNKLITQDLTKWDYVHLVTKPLNLNKHIFYLYYYLLVIKLFKLAKRNNVYDFIDFKKLRKNFFGLVVKD